MTEPKFTPGPWVREPKSDGLKTAWTGSKAIAAHDPYTNATMLIAHTTRGFPEEESEANARLIAAAPELYEALQSLVALHHPYHREAKAALAKARGEDTMTDVRLEAVAEAYLCVDGSFSPTATAKAFLAMYDAARAFDDASIVQFAGARLEAVALEIARHRDLAFWPDCAASDRAAVYATATAHLAWYDAARAFDAALAKARGEEVMPHSASGRTKPSASSSEDNASAPLAGADPPNFIK